jgi:hypothetical protein
MHAVIFTAVPSGIRSSGRLLVDSYRESLLYLTTYHTRPALRNGGSVQRAVVVRQSQMGKPLTVKF